MQRNLGFRIAITIVGLAALAFGIFTGFAHGWELDIINLITIGAAIVLILVGIFAKNLGMRSKSVLLAE